MATFDRSVLGNPRWILAIVVAVAFAAIFVRLAVWQLDRLDERRISNALIEERATADPAPLADLIATHGARPEDLIHRRVVIEGTFREDLEFISVGRTYGESRGSLVLTPMELDDGRLIVIVRGVVPPDAAGPPTDGYRPPPGRVIVTGRIDDGEEPLRLGEPDPADGVLVSLGRVDLAYVDRWIDGDVLPISLLLEASDPAPPDAAPARAPADELDEGSHLGYAVQWFGFAVVAVAGVAFLVYRAGTADEDATESAEMQEVS